MKKEDKKNFAKLYISAKTISGIQKGSLDSFSLFIEHGYNILAKLGYLTYIVPIAFTSSDSLSGTHRLLLNNCKRLFVSSYAVRPQPVFKNAVVNTSIIAFHKTQTLNEEVWSTKMHRKGSSFNLDDLIKNLKFAEVSDYLMFGRIPKISEPIEKHILEKISKYKRVSDYKVLKGSPIYYRSTGGRYFKIVTNYSTGSSKEKVLSLAPDYADAIGCILSSNLAFWFYQIYSNNLDWREGEISAMPIPSLSRNQIRQLCELYRDYLIDIEKNVNVRQTTEQSKYQMDTFKEYKIVKSKPLIDKIDDTLCPLYGLNKEETDFVKNYELEFRLSGDD